MVIVSTKDKPLLFVVLAGLFFIIAVYLIGLSFYNLQFSLEPNLIQHRVSLIIIIILFIIAGVSLSQKNTMFFDLTNKKFKDQFSVGPFKVGSWQDLPPLNYISIFSVDARLFEVNLWYDKNEHFNIYTFKNRDKAFETGIQIASQLKIKLLDATERNNYKYVNIDALKEGEK